MKAALAAVCVLTLLATAYLTLSLLVLRPPRANYPAWFVQATLFLSQSGLTLFALSAVDAAAGTRRFVRYAVLAGAAAIAWIGVSAIRATLTGPHFEGYALLLGSGLVLQALMTFAVLGRATAFRSAAAQ